MSFYQYFRFGLRLLYRDWRAGELHVLLAALIIAVSATTTVGFFTDRMARGLLNDSAELLGADLALQSARPIPDAWLVQAKDFELASSKSLGFESVVVFKEEFQLASAKAVDGRFPVRGELRLAKSSLGKPESASGAPANGTVWVDARLLARLGANIGEQIELGDIDVVITHIITFEPGVASGGIGISPRLMMSIEDIPAANIVQPGSRVKYDYQFAGTPEAIARFRNWLEPKLEASHELVGVREGSRAVGTAIARAERYLGLAIIVATILAGVAIAMAANRYSRRHFDISAMMRCLGVSQNNMLKVFLPQMLVLAIVGSAIGCVFGWLIEKGLAQLLVSLLPGAGLSPGWTPIFAGFLTGFAALVGFALPPVLQLKDVPPLRVLRNELEPVNARGLLPYVFAIGCILFLLLRITNDITLTLLVFLGGVAVTLAFALIAWLLLRTSSLSRNSLGAAWRYGLTSLLRRARVNVGQVIAFGLVMMAMVLIALLRTDLLTAWKTQLPQDVPNHFAINILPDEIDNLSEFFTVNGIEPSALYPLYRGRLTNINGERIRTHVSKEEQNNNAINRELNLTASTVLADDNKIVAGRWFAPGDTGQQLVSVEAELAERLNINLNDMLTFSIGGFEISVKVISLRSVQWDSFRPNFYMIFPPGVLDELPSTYMTSFKAGDANGQDAKQIVVDMVRKFPSVTVLELDAVIQQVGKIFKQVTLAVEYVLILVLLAGFIVLFAALQSSLDERLFEGALLRTLGASRYQINTGQLVEFAVLGFIAGLLAAIGAELIAWLLYIKVFNIDYTFSGWIALATPLVGSLLIATAGYLGTRAVVNQAPLRVLHNA